MTMKLEDVRNILKTHNSLVVHFSGTPRGIGAGQTIPDFPGDLQQVVQNRPTWEIPCSTVGPDHSRASGTLMGSVGLIIRLKMDGSLLGVCSSDAGSSYDSVTGRRDIGACVVPDSATCAGSITARSGHNEWIVRDFDVPGLFFDRTMAVWDGMGRCERETSLAEIAEAFGNVPVLCFHGAELWEIGPETQRRDLTYFI